MGGAVFLGNGVFIKNIFEMTDFCNEVLLDSDILEMGYRELFWALKLLSVPEGPAVVLLIIHRIITDYSFEVYDLFYV